MVWWWWWWFCFSPAVVKELALLSQHPKQVKKSFFLLLLFSRVFMLTNKAACVTQFLSGNNNKVCSYSTQGHLIQ